MKKFVIGTLLLFLVVLVLLFLFMPADVMSKIGERARLRSQCTQRVMDSNANGLIETEEMMNAKNRILLYDENDDGMMSRAELGGLGTYKDSLRNSKIVRAIDVNGDSEFSLEELNNAKFVIPHLDLNNDGVLDKSEYQ